MMKRDHMLCKVDDFNKIVKGFHDDNVSWVYLKTIKYMLSSKLYVDGILDDISIIVEKNECNESDGCSVLDFGCGSGIIAYLLSHSFSKKSSYFAIDTDDIENDNGVSNPIDNENIIFAQSRLWEKIGGITNINFSHYDGRRLPYDDGSFDCIVAYAVIEHVGTNNIKNILIELNRVLKDGGKLFIFKFPRKLSYQEFMAKIMGVGHHSFTYSDKEAKVIFSEVFKVEEIWKGDMVFEFPPSFSNYLYWPLKWINYVLERTPFKVFSHHNGLALSKLN
jgi:ubiquinone/menaquinone biosynthesis C-methylase UbiE